MAVAGSIQYFIKTSEQIITGMQIKEMIIKTERTGRERLVEFLEKIILQET